ncbi:D-alanyl-D-alanine carboxypeptidase family protein [Janibacter melonis]|uniref:D-alanyl-D-alanine carboxypeptidase family protein n=1 Tax=Janibacter melonis TaxID=262209 RepID=UPI0020943B33|nr:D-alanyl-D-alanine carboxypeptidase family protein [Janibacter melonis]
MAVCTVAGSLTAPAAVADPSPVAPTSTTPAPTSTTEPAPTGTTAPTTGDPAGEPADPTSPGASGSESSSDPFAYDESAKGEEDDALSPAEVKKQVDEANALAASILKNNKEIGSLVTELRRHSTRANTLLERYSEATSKHRAAKKEADEARRASTRLKNRLDAGREDLRDWAFGTYTEAGGYTDTMAFLNIMTKSPAKAGDSAGDLSYLTDERIHSVDLVRVDTITAAQLSRKRAKAEKRAKSEKAKADKARKDLTAVITERKATLETLRKEYASELKEAGPLVKSLLGLTDPDAQDAQESLAAAMEKAGQDVSAFEGAAPCSDNEGTYPNGQVPPNALCPLIGAAGEMLRPKAAAAFNEMSKAYARDTGSPICITDSYRSYAEQVIVKQQRGGWAATPGRSNHGLGLALDLCGGINSFGTAAHAWMQQNAALYGWFHPAWAQAGGSLPEPWHWEYAG